MVSANNNNLANPSAPYFIDGNTLYKRNDDASYTLISRRVEIIRRLLNDDTGKITLELSFDYAGSSHTIEISRGLLTRRKISELLVYGVDVSDQKASAIVEWLSYQEEHLPIERVHSTVGFDFSQSPPVFKHYQAIGMDSKYTGPLQIHPKGTYEDWHLLVKEEVMGHPPLELALVLGLCAPVASCINHISGGEVLLFHLCGNSTQGKTTAVMLSISTFGTPIVGHSSLLKDWNGTRNAVLAQLRDIQGLPVAFDEGSMLEGEYGNLIYQLASGKDKSRLDSEGTLRRSGQWSGSIISNGERSLSRSSSKNAGSQIRITELSNIPWTQSAENANRLKEGLLRHHGHAGPRFVEYLLTQGLDQLDMRRRSWSKRIEAEFSNADTFTQRLSDKIAILLVTAELANEAFGWGLDVQAISSLLISATAQASGQRDIGKHAYQYLMECIHMHENHFYVDDVPPSIEPVWGKWIVKDQSLKEIYIFPTVFQSLMKQGGFENPSTILQLWKVEGLLDCESNKLTRKKVLSASSSSRVHVVRMVESADSDPV
ncbi:DUF927 domain-containing protein [Paenibacillus sp. FSL R7-0337]|uniref:DUF927 domain-containing protein n=1 Tax=Paenibacillus sp. FSL R7-0337 TaxID=1926588 RepID=UPI00096D8A2C|nr:DUF927 domain-containing protein [Paenibacillus sp. FSL R7-0337]OMF96824.1 hypothetical protein BK147_11680 [Paenibacillus sp. FSL R7-0337]